MKLQSVMRIVATLALVCARALFFTPSLHARRSLISARSTRSNRWARERSAAARHRRRSSNDGERHTVFFTIIESNTDAKIYWRSMDGDQTTLMQGPGVKAFQTAGTFKVEALGDDSRSFKYGYVLLRLKNSRGT